VNLEKNKMKKHFGIKHILLNVLALDVQPLVLGKLSEKSGEVDMPLDSSCFWISLMIDCTGI